MLFRRPGRDHPLICDGHQPGHRHLVGQPGQPLAGLGQLLFPRQHALPAGALRLRLGPFTRQQGLHRLAQDLPLAPLEGSALHHQLQPERVTPQAARLQQTSFGQPPIYLRLLSASLAIHMDKRPHSVIM